MLDAQASVRPLDCNGPSYLNLITYSQHCEKSSETADLFSDNLETTYDQIASLRDIVEQLGQRSSTQAGVSKRRPFVVP